MVKYPNPYVTEAIQSSTAAPVFIPVNLPRQYGQCAEDYLVLSILRAYAAREGIDLQEERYLEIGANHPFATSASYLLHIGLGMKGVLVEANPDLIDDLRKHRIQDDIVNLAIVARETEFAEFIIADKSELSTTVPTFTACYSAFEATEVAKINVPAKRINDLIGEQFPDKPPIFVSIDVEGADLSIVMDWDLEKRRPLVIQVEASPDSDKNSYSAIITTMAASNYLCVMRTDVNLILIDAMRNSGIPGTEILPNGMSFSDFIGSLSEIDVFSVDVFDTLLARKTIRPAQVFDYIETKFKIPGFAQARIEAEQSARSHFLQTRGAEVSLDEIYRFFNDAVILPKNIQEIELEAENFMLYPREEVLFMLGVARSLGKRVIAISDMYLSSDTI